jgi:hypothetical protein
MSDQTDAPSKLANFEAVIGCVRALRSQLDGTFIELGHPPSEAVDGYVRELRSGLDTTLITLEHLASNLRSAAKPSGASQRAYRQHAHVVRAAAEPEELRPVPCYYRCRNCGYYHELGLSWSPSDCVSGSETRFSEDDLNKVHANGWVQRRALEANREVSRSSGRSTGPRASEKPMYYECPSCGYYAKPGAAHYCCDFNNFRPDELSIIHGKEGWDVTEIPEQPAPAEAAVNCEQTQVFQEAPKPLGMRKGSKKHRVYETTRNLLEKNGSMHIDDIIESVDLLGVFEGVMDRRINFSNILSQLKAKGLVISDNRGNWSLPNGKAAQDP